MANPTSQLFYDPVARPTSAGVALPLAYYNFYVSGTTTPALIYQDAGLTTPFPANASGLYIVTADSTGAFPPMYMSPSIVYRVQLFNQLNVLLEDVDPYVPSFPVSGNGPITLNAFGEITINQPLSGGTGVALTVVPSASGKSVQFSGSGAGNPALIVNNAVTVGTTTAFFNSTNKPGFAATAATTTVAPSGASYGGGNLTANFTGVTGTGYVMVLSTGQVLSGVNLTNGSAAFTCVLTTITGTPSTSVSIGSGPQKWLPIQCDGGLYYWPLFL